MTRLSRFLKALLIGIAVDLVVINSGAYKVLPWYHYGYWLLSRNWFFPSGYYIGALWLLIVWEVKKKWLIAN